MNQTIIPSCQVSRPGGRGLSGLCAGLLLLLCILPAAAIPVPYGQPDYTATVSGDTELQPGNITPLTVTLTNTGHAPEMILDPTDPVASSPAIGIGAELTLHPGDAPVDIPATSLTIPALLPDATVDVTFPVIVPADATGGSYTLDLEVNSQYAQSVTMEGTSNVFHYMPLNVTLPVPITIADVVRVRVDSLSVSNLSPGQDGRITATITNTGQYAGKHAIAELVVEKGSPIVPYQGSYSLGTFAPGQQQTVEWRASVLDTIDASSVPATLEVSYDDKHGILTSSQPVQIGIPVATGPKFAISYGNPVIEPGGTITITVTYTNTGDTPATDASAKIVPISPVSSSQGGIMLGTLNPGESAGAVYEVTLDDKALVKTYGILTDVKYRGEDGLVTLSDPMQIELTTVPEGILAMILSPLSLILILGIILIGGYLFLKKEGRI